MCPNRCLQKWLNARGMKPVFANSLRRVYQYRKQVLAIFDELVLNEKNRPPLSSNLRNRFHSSSSFPLH